MHLYMIPHMRKCLCVRVCVHDSLHENHFVCGLCLLCVGWWGLHTCNPGVTAHAHNPNKKPEQPIRIQIQSIYKVYIKKINRCDIRLLSDMQTTHVGRRNYYIAPYYIVWSDRIDTFKSIFYAYSEISFSSSLFYLSHITACNYIWPRESFVSNRFNRIYIVYNKYIVRDVFTWCPRADFCIERIINCTAPRICVCSPHFLLWWGWFG